MRRNRELFAPAERVQGMRFEREGTGGVRLFKLHAEGNGITFSDNAWNNEVKPWLNKYWCIVGKLDAAYVCAMEDVLDVYHRPYDPKHL